MPDFTLDNVAETVTRMMRKRYNAHPEIEDAIQEGIIQAWSSMEKGNEDFWHVVNRGVRWGFNHMFDETRQYTGHQTTSREGRLTEQGNLTREKIKSYRDDYIRLHDKEPSGAAIARAIGINQSAVNRHLKIIKESAAYNVGVRKREDGRTDTRAYAPISLTALTESYGPDSDSEKLVDAMLLPYATAFEGSVLQRIQFEDLISALGPDQRAMVVMHYDYGFTESEIGKHFGFKYPQQQTQRELKKIHKQIRLILRPEEAVEKCRKGHIRTDDNTGHKASGERYCKDCRKASERCTLHGRSKRYCEEC